MCPKNRNSSINLLITCIIPTLFIMIVNLEESASALPSSNGVFVPEETSEHACTWMIFGGHYGLYDDWTDHVQRAVCRVARTIAQFEPVKMVVTQSNRRKARRYCGPTVELVNAPSNFRRADIWMRDTAPIFVKQANGTMSAVSLNFNGWGNKQDPTTDKLIAEYVATLAGVTNLQRANIVGEGGGVEFDGEGTIMLTESSWLNPNRNPGKTKAQIEAEMSRLFGVSKFIWLPGIAGKDITDGHVDFYARFVRPGVVIANYDDWSYEKAVTTKSLEILNAAIDAKGRRLEVHVVSPPSKTRPQFEGPGFASGYINFVIVNGGILVPEFGDRSSDKTAFVC